MLLKLINIGLLLAFSILYMEWGRGQSAYVFEVEYDLLFRKKNLLESITHPVILFGLTGQLLLLGSVIKRNRFLNLAGVLLLSAVAILISAAALSGMNLKMLLLAAPFLSLMVLYFLKVEKKKNVLVR